MIVISNWKGGWRMEDQGEIHTLQSSGGLR